MADHDEKHDEHGEGGHGGRKHKGGHGGGHGGHGGEEHGEGAPEWLISFADNVMLMMGFFVILFTLNMGPKGGGSDADREGGEPPDSTEIRWLDFVIGVREAFNNPIKLDSTDPAEAKLVARLRQRRAMESGDVVNEGTEGSGKKVTVPEESRRFGEGTMVLFAENSTVLSAEATQTIAQIADRIKGRNVVIEVRGHAGRGEGFRNFDSGMRLSYERAMAVSKALIDHGVDDWNLRLLALADHEPAVPHPQDRDEDRDNARVQVIATDVVVGDRAPTGVR